MIHKTRILLMFAISSYGVRVTTEECSVAVVVMSCQCIVGVIIQVTRFHLQSGLFSLLYVTFIELDY